MKHFNSSYIASKLFSASLGLLLLGLGATGAFAQSAGRVSLYKVTTPTLTWNDISGTGTNTGYGRLTYGNYAQFGSLPFAFNYDNTNVPAFTPLYVWEGTLQFGSLYTDEPSSSYFGSSGSMPGCIFFAGSYTCEGSGQQGSGIYYETDGVAPYRVYTVEFVNVHTYYAGTSGHGGLPCSVQIKLFETTNNIQILYQKHSFDFAYSPYPVDIGLDGFSSPSYTYLSYATSQVNTPSTDLQFAPPVPPYELSLVPKSLNFGTTTPQNPVTLCVTAKSVGVANTVLHVLGYSLTGSSAYSMVNAPVTGTAISQGSSVQYCIQFLPLSNGGLGGTFTLITDGIDSGTQSVNLTGIGSVPDVSYGASEMFHGVFTKLRDTSATQYLTVKSTGNAALTFNSIYFTGLNGNNYFVSHMPQNPLPSGQTDSIGVRFTPTIEGRPDAHMVINTTATNIPWDTVTFFGIGTLRRLVINNAYSNTVNMSFDSVRVGVDSCLEITLVNPGSDTLAITDNFISNSDYDFAMTPLTGKDTLILPGGGTKQIQVCFKPLKPGYRTSTIRITTNIQKTFNVPPKDTSGFSVVVTGIGVPFGHLAITGPDTIPVTAVGTQLCWTDTLWNTGSATTVVSNAVITGLDSAEFSYSGLTFPLIMQSNTFQTFQVCGTPMADSTRSAVLTAIDADNSASIPLNVFGTTVCAKVAFVTNFPASTCIGSLDTATISVTNCGNVSTPYTATITGPNASQFAIIGSAISPSEGAGGVATYMVTYTPDTLDATSSATFNVTGGPGGTLALSAAHSAATIAGSEDTTVNVSTASIPISVTVNNTGTCMWDPGTPVVTSPYTYSSGSAPIAGGATGTLMFSFDPSVAGTFPQTVQFPGATGTSLPAPNVKLNATATSASVPMMSAKDGYSIEQNYPNPFTNKSDVEITMANAGQVHLAILDITGKVVENVLDQQEDAGSFIVSIDASGLASGTYFYQMTSGGVTLTRQMSVVK